MFGALTLICGILCSYFIMVKNIIAFILVIVFNLLSYVIFLVKYSKKEKFKRNLIACCCFLLSFTLGYTLFSFEIDNYVKNDLGGHYYTIFASVEEFNETDYGGAVILNNVNLKGVYGGEKDYKIALTIYGETNLNIGDEITFSANLIDKSIFYEDRFCAEAISEKIKWQVECNASDITYVKNSANVFQVCNTFIKNSLNNGLNKKEFGVALAMLTGNSDYFANYLLYNYRNLGIAHIFAISGLHMGFICAFLSLIFKHIKINKIVKFFIITFALFFYSGICGFTSSSLRASIMCSVALLGRALGKRYDGITAVSLSAILILIIKPSQLFCVGFILSFTAVVGILLLSKPISKVFKFLPKKLADSIGVVLSAGLSTFPVLIDYFGSVSVISILANLIIVPLVSFVFILVLMGAIFGGIFNVSNILLFPSNYILKGLNFVVSFTDYGIFRIFLVPFGAVSLLYFFSLVALSGFINIKLKLKRIIPISCISIFIIVSIFVNVTTINKVNYYVIGGENISATLIENNNESCLIISGTTQNFSQTKLSRLFSVSKTDKLNSVVILNDGKQKDIQLFATRLTHIIEVDSIIYSNNLNVVGINAFYNCFPNIQLNSYGDNEIINFKNFNLSFDIGGYSAKINGKTTLIFSQFGSDYQGYGYITENFNNVIAGECVQSIISQFESSNVISFRSSTIVKSAEREGFIKLNP